MTNADSSSDDYTTQPPAVFDETDASGLAGADASAVGGADASDARELVGAGAAGAAGASGSGAGAARPATQPTAVFPATQPTVPLSDPRVGVDGHAHPSTSGYPEGRAPANADAAAGYAGSGNAGYAQAGYSAPALAAAAATVYPPARRTSILAVLTLVFGILGFGVVPVVTGHIALSQLKRTGEEGRGLALAGLILGYVTVAGWLFAALAWLGVAGAALIAAFFSAVAS